jgi:hypothetical protein
MTARSLILAFVATAAISFLTAPDMAAAQQFGDKCSRACGCEELQCLDFCGTNCTGACGRRFDAIVRQCEKTCNMCRRFTPRPTPGR